MKFAFAISIIFILFSNRVVSQSIPHGFNFQAVIRDDSGNLSTEVEYELRASIILGVIDGEAVQVVDTLYSESHVVITSIYGQIALVIGQGQNPTIEFSDLDWAASLSGDQPAYLLIESLDSSSGSLSVLSLSQLLAVPFALISSETLNEKDGDAENELQTLYREENSIGITLGNEIDLSEVSFSGVFVEENNKVQPKSEFEAMPLFLGQRQLLDTNAIYGYQRNHAFFFNPNNGVFRVGWDYRNDPFDWSLFELGERSISLGGTNDVQSFESISLGGFNHHFLAAHSSTGVGLGNELLAHRTMALGIGNLMKHENSKSFGRDLVSSNAYEVLLGYSNSYQDTLEGWQNRILTVGNGNPWASHMGRSNALVVLMNGNSGFGKDVPEFRLDVEGDINFSGILRKDGQPVPLNQTLSLDGNVLTLSGGNSVEILTDVFDVVDVIQAKQLFDDKPFFLGEAANSPNQLFNTFFYNPSNGIFRVGAESPQHWDGWPLNDQGERSIALGSSNLCMAENSIALGRSNEVNSYGIAIGDNNELEESSTFALGADNKLLADGAIVIGQGLIANSENETVIGRWNDHWPIEERILSIGNGSGNNDRSNAMVIMKNGDVAFGKDMPLYNIDIAGSINFDGSLYKEGELFEFQGPNYWSELQLDTLTIRTEKFVEVPRLEVKNGSDIAEFFDSSEELYPGDVVSICEGGVIQRSKIFADAKVIGVVSGGNGMNVGLTLMQPGVSDGRYPVAFAGQVYVKFRGDAEIGSLLVSSNEPGFAEVCPEPSEMTGKIIGKVLAHPENGFVRMLVMNK